MKPFTAVLNALLGHFALWTLFWVLLMLEVLTDQDRPWWVIALPLIILYGGIWTATIAMLWLAHRRETLEAGDTE